VMLGMMLNMLLGTFERNFGVFHGGG
jgi:hypothetical protein